MEAQEAEETSQIAEEAHFSLAVGTPNRYTRGHVHDAHPSNAPRLASGEIAHARA